MIQPTQTKVIRLYDHQKTALELLTNNNRFALFMEMGTGKTIPTIYHVTNLLLSGEIEDCLIVCPLSTMGSWIRDIEKLSGIRKSVVDKIKVINYDKVWRREEYNKEWGCIVLDEAHSIAHKTSKRTKFLLKLSRGIEYRYILTGTPLGNGRLEDFYTLLTFLDSNIFGTYKEFASRYLIERQLSGSFVSIVVGYRNQDELLSIIGDYSYRVTKKDCLDLPEKIEEVIECDLLEKRIYKQALKDFIADFDMAIGNPLTKVMKLRQIPNGFVYDDYGDLQPLKTNKLNMFEELIDSILPNKITVFCEFQYSIQQIEKLLISKKIKYVILDGKQKDKKIWRKFQSDESIKVIICQYLTANSGIDLYASSYMIYFEPNLSTTVISQSADRIHRIGQNNVCTYYWLITKDTIEQDIYNRLNNKMDFNKDCLVEIARGK